MKKILLIEDDTDLFNLVQYNLEKEGFTFTGAKTGRGALDLCRREKPDLAILDIMLPDSDGLDICRGIRSDPEIAHIPIIFLTARAAETDRIVGLELGGNDYIVKPFYVRELIARVRTQFRTAATQSNVIRDGDLELNRTACQVRLRGAEVSLTATEFRMLDVIMSRPGVVFSREQLLDAVWGSNHAITDRAVDVYILRLRQKVEGNPASPERIRSVRGFGYTFKPAVGEEGRV
jgi:DNA-binding response OmpR family regulator